MPGPVPKRSTQRRRRNATGVERIDVGARPAIEAPELRPGLHPLARRWYEALAISGQAIFYEPSDWMMAQIVAEAIDAYAVERRAVTLQTIMEGASLLLTTEGDRRRLRLELERGDVVDADEERAVASVADLRAKLSG